MLISSREAAQILAATSLSRERARVLSAGFAGDGLRTRGSLLYEEERVRALLEWPEVDPRVLRDTCAQGLFVARVGALGAEAAADVRQRAWQLSPWARLEMRRVIEAQGIPAARHDGVWVRGFGC